MRKSLVAVLSALVAATSATAAAAAGTSKTYDLTIAEASFGNVASFGTVKVTEAASGKLDFLVSLADGFRFNGSNNKNHHAFTFELAGDPRLTFSNVTAGFTAIAAAASSISQSPFGKAWDYGIDCIDLKKSAAGSGCRPGYDSSNPSTLSFTVASSGGNLTLGSIEASSYEGRSIYFAVDVVSAKGVTGNVAALASPVPEPAEWAMILAGLGIIGWVTRKRRQLRPF